MKHTYYKLKLDALVVLGGNGSQKTANLLSEEGLNVIGLPKTIDNDLYGTDMTFGFQSAVDIATNAIDCIHTTAASHGRVFIVEIMGHKVGWLTLHAGIAGGADIILLPEIPYDLKKVVAKIEERTKSGSRFSILARGRVRMSMDLRSSEQKENKEKLKRQKVRVCGDEIGEQIGENDRDRRGHVGPCGPGHMQRGGGARSSDHGVLPLPPGRPWRGADYQ